MTTASGPAAVGQAGGGSSGAIPAADEGAGQHRRQSVTGFAPGPAWMRYLPPAAATALAFWGITTPSYWRDEAATLAAVRRPFGDLIAMLGNVDAVHSVYYLLMWVVIRLAGTGELALRFPTALAVPAATAAVAATGRRLVSPGAGLASGLLFAVLPAVTRYGQEARPYELVVALAAVASYLLVRLIQAEPAARRRWLAWYGLSLAALGVMNIFALLLVPAHAVTVALWYRRSAADGQRRWLLARWLIAAAIAVVVASPLLYLGWQQQRQIAWLAVNKSSSGPGTLLTIIGNGPQGFPALVTLLVVVVIAVAVLAGAARQPAAAPRAALPELTVPWLVLPPALLLGVSVVHPIYTTRYVLMCIPALALLGGAAIAALGRIGGPAALLVIALAGLPAQRHERSPAGHYDDIRAVDRYVSGHAKPGDVLLYTNPNAGTFGAAYRGGLDALPEIELKQGPDASGTLAGTNVPVPVLRQRLAAVSRVWVVEINKESLPPRVLRLNGLPGRTVFGSLPFRLAATYHLRGDGDWLLLFVRG